MSCRVLLRNACVEFPVFTARSRGLLNSVVGFSQILDRRIERANANRVVVKALRDVTLDFQDGDRVGILGSNGAGKTTLLRLTSGIYEPTAGSVEIFGDVASLTDLMLGMDGDATGLENIRLRARFMGIHDREALDELIADVVEFTELGEHLELPVRTYSSGMLVRLAFAVSTSIEPQILVMDEMIGAGDYHFRERAQRRLDRMLSKVRILIVASHDLGVLRTFCNRAVVLHEGRVRFAGSVEEGIAHYTSASAI